MNVRLTPHSERLIKEQIAHRGYDSPEDVIEHALEVLAEREWPREAVPKDAASAIADILELRKGVTLGGLKIKELIHEGHRI